MTTRDLTTVQISKTASDQLTELARVVKRSKTAHAEWLIEQDYQKRIDPGSNGNGNGQENNTPKAQDE